MDYQYPEDFKVLKEEYERAMLTLALVAETAAAVDAKGHWLIVDAAQKFKQAGDRYFNHGKENN